MATPALNWVGETNSIRSAAEEVMQSARRPSLVPQAAPRLACRFVKHSVEPQLADEICIDEILSLTIDPAGSQGPQGIVWFAEAVPLRRTGADHTRAPAATEALIMSRREIPPWDCPSGPIESSTLFMSSTSAPKLEECS